MAVQDFRKDVYKRLIDVGKTTPWLCEEVTKRTGLYCDTSYLSKIFLGRRKAKSVVAAICEILDIEVTECRE